MGKPHLIIPAAGVGSRMNADRPKQYLTVAGKQVIEHTIGRLLNSHLFQQIIIVINPNDPYWPQCEFFNHPLIQTVHGGAERWHSVLNGLNHLNDSVSGTRQKSNDIVLVHDCARPCVNLNDIKKLLDADLSEGGLLAIKAKDTLKKAVDHQVEATLDRTQVWQAFTPQAAPLQLLLKCLNDAIVEGKEVTDEASALELSGLHPVLIESSDLNLKITRPDDLILAEAILTKLNSDA